MLYNYLLEFYIYSGGPRPHYDYESDYDVKIPNPKFISQSKKITVNEGDTINLPCTVDNLDNLVIIWKKGEDIISVGNNFMNVNDKR